MIGSADICEFFRTYLGELERRQDELDRLDAVAGDGDHGATMVMGMREVVATLDDVGRSPAEVLRTAAEAFGSVGGAIGPLWGTALVRAARAAGMSETLDAATTATLLTAAVQGLRDRGHSEPGDKTLVDVMGPGATAFAEEVADGLDGTAALRSALASAESGLAGTVGVAARRGRARRVAERSVGSPDPGGASALLAWEVAARLGGVTRGPAD